MAQKSILVVVQLRMYIFLVGLDDDF